MAEKYEQVYKAYKSFMESNSQYGVEVKKYNTNTSAYFPLITIVQSNLIDTDESTIDKIEYYDAFYFTIDIYTKDKTISSNGVSSKVASELISEELINLTIQFFKKLNMKRTLCRPTPNLDTSILRKTLQYQCLMGNTRGNIIRR